MPRFSRAFKQKTEKRDFLFVFAFLFTVSGKCIKHRNHEVIIKNTNVTEL